MKIALIGASGNVGSRIAAELSGRGHEITAIARKAARISALPGVKPTAVDIANTEALVPVLQGHAAVISSVHFVDSDPDQLIRAVKAAGVPRYLVVGGAGSLQGKLLVDSPDFPKEYEKETRAGVGFLDRLRAEKDLNWTFLSPSYLFTAGERTGNFRLGKDTLLINAAKAAPSRSRTMRSLWPTKWRSRSIRASASPSVTDSIGPQHQVTLMNITSNGIRLHVSDNSHGNLALVFLHCWGGSSRTWDRVLAALPPGCRTVAIDQRGWGSSEHPSSGYSVADLGNDTAGAIEALGLERYILVGHSMGGKTAQFLASRRPKGLVGLVLVAPAPPSPLNLPEETRVNMSGPNVSEVVTAAIKQVLTFKPISREDTEVLVSDAVRASPAARTAWPRQTSLEDITSAVGQINVPTLVISGDKDKVDPVETLKRELLPRISGAVLQVLPDVGHLSPLEAPKEIALHLDSFVKELQSKH